MRLKSIDLDLMEGNGSGKRRESHFLIGLSRLLSNMGEETLWFGEVLDMVEWET